MSLTSSLQRIVQAKADIKSAIEAKGVTVGDNVSIADYDDYIAAISGGGGGATQTKTVALNMANGDQVITPDTGYVLSQVTVEKPATLIPANIVNGVTIGGVTGTASSGGGSQDYDDLKGIVNGTITSFTMPSGMTNIFQYRFYQMTSITSADLSGCQIVGYNAFYGASNLATVSNTNSIATVGGSAFGSTKITNIDISNASTIGDAAFSNCTSLTTVALHPTITIIPPNCFSGCTSLTTINIPTSLTIVGAYALYQVPAAMTLKPTNTITVGGSAFEGCTGLTEVEGTFNYVDNYSLASCTELKKVKIKILSSVGAYAIAYCAKINDIDISQSTITSVASSGFRNIGVSRSDPSSNILTLDFRNSTFTTTSQYLFGGTSSGTTTQYIRALYPTTLTGTLPNYAFRYTNHCIVYFSTATPPNANGTNTWANFNNPTIFVPYDSINAYKTKSNWTTQANYIYGWAAENTFQLNDTLPSTNAEGKTLTWYSDEAMTNQVTTVSDPTQIYYCTASA